MMRKKDAVAAWLMLCLPGAGLAQEVPAPQEAAVLRLADPHAGSAVLAQGTPIRLMVLNEVSSAKAKPGDRFVLRVDETIAVNGRTAIPVGVKAYGEVTEVKESGGLGKAGGLGARLLYIDLPGREVPIEGERSAKGNGSGGQTAMAVIGLGVFGLFAQGHNAKMKAGELMTAYLAADTDFGTPPAP